MKFGQALSVMEAAMPEELAGPYRATLTKLQEAAPPMAVERVHAILADQLGPRWRTAKFQSFEDLPVAAASIGQVHRGVWRDGREVAIKVQYPGAGAALLSDITQLSRVARLAGAWIPGIAMGPILEEVRDRMSEELDYDLEATNQRIFAKAFRGDTDVFVPDVLAHSAQVIVSEWVEGRPLSKVIAEGTPAERDQAGDLYLEFLLRGPNRARLLHADPHPGNFRITPDGRLGVLDFGAVNRLPDGMPSAMGEIITRTLAEDAAGLGVVLRRAGFIRPGVEVSDDALLRYLRTFVEPLQRESFTFSRSWLRSVSATLQDPRRDEFLVGLRFNLPPEFLLIHRVWLGSIGVLCQVGGTVRMRDLVFAHVPGIDEDAVPPPL
jgi:predicted unusual protein kinase regulating ubiquinone biosynthesis (AarF/ABC1/UbiB family)